MNAKIIFFLGGVATGAVATFLVLKRRMDQRIEEEVAGVKEVYSTMAVGKNASEGILKGLEEEKESDDIPTEEVGKNDPEASKDAIKRNEQIKADLMKTNALIKENGYTVDTHKTSYNLFSHPPAAKDIHNGVDEDEDLEIEIGPDNVEDDPEVIDTTSPYNAPGPYVLEPDDDSSAAWKFINEEPYFDKVTLFLYDDGVLCSDENELITNIAATVGHEALERIGEYEPDVVYVRNEQTSTDYEIVRQYRDFVSIPRDSD